MCIWQMTKIQMTNDALSHTHTHIVRIKNRVLAQRPPPTASQPHEASPAPNRAVHDALQVHIHFVRRSLGPATAMTAIDGCI